MGDRAHPVKFNKVHIVQYKRTVGGSCGVPEKGRFPLGLSFEVKNEQTMSFAEYTDRAQKRSALLEECNEKKRKKLLRESVDPLDSYDDTFDLELQQTMKRVAKGGCRCKTACGPRCVCVSRGNMCIFGVCACSSRDCENIREDDPCIDNPFDDTEAGQRGILLEAPTTTPQKKNSLF